MIGHPYDAYAVLVIVAAAFAAFLSERWRPDVVSLLVMGLLLALGLLGTRDVVAVFSNEAPITVAVMFVLSAALERTGVVERCGVLASRVAGSSPRAGLLTVTLGAATVSAFMNNTPVVVVLTPVVIGLAQSLKMSPAKFLIPLSYATVMGGTCTLIGTSTNLVASGAAVQHGLEPFGLLEIAPLGIPVTLIGIAYLMLFGFRLLPDRSTFAGTIGDGRQRQFLADVLVPLGSPLVGRTLAQAEVAKKLATRIVDVIRNRASFGSDADRVVIEAGDRLVFRTNVADVMDLRAKTDVVFGAHGDHALEPIATQNTKIMEGIVGPRSSFAGRRLAELNLRRAHGVYVLAVHRHGENLGPSFDRVRLEFGDTLLIEGPPEGLQQLFEQGALVALSEPSQQRLRHDRAWLALLALAAVVVLASLEIMPIAGLALIAAAVVVAGGCLDVDEAHAAIRWPIMLLIFGSLALGRAMESTGAAQLIVDSVVGVAAGLSPVMILALVYLVTMVLTEFLSNNATAILLTPIAIGLAQGLGVDPRPFVVAVMFAASNAFATPIGYQTNMFVYSAGGYRFTDFMWIGLPLNVIVWIASSLLIPQIWPLTPLAAG